MGWVDAVKDLGQEIAKLFKELVTLQAEVRAIEKTVDRQRQDQKDFIDHTRQDVRDLQKDFDEVRRRLSRVEGTLDSVVERSMKEAILQLAREHQREHGSLDGFALKLLPGAESSDEA